MIFQVQSLFAGKLFGKLGLQKNPLEPLRTSPGVHTAMENQQNTIFFILGDLVWIRLVYPVSRAAFDLRRKIRKRKVFSSRFFLEDPRRLCSQGRISTCMKLENNIFESCNSRYESTSERQMHNWCCQMLLLNEAKNYQ